MTIENPRKRWRIYSWIAGIIIENYGGFSSSKAWERSAPQPQGGELPSPQAGSDAGPARLPNIGLHPVVYFLENPMKIWMILKDLKRASPMTMETPMKPFLWPNISWERGMITLFFATYSFLWMYDVMCLAPASSLSWPRYSMERCAPSEISPMCKWCSRPLGSSNKFTTCMYSCLYVCMYVCMHACK